MARFVFLHGLNTYGDDELHVGLFKYGPMNDPWEKALRSHGVEAYCPDDLGYHPIEQQAEMLIERLKKKGWLEQRDLFLIGHSSGGLIARVVASHNETRDKVIGVLTLGTPHHGTRAAELGLKLGAENSKWGKILSFIGYDPRKRNAVFERYLAKTLLVFNARYPLPDSIFMGYALCETKKSDLSWPLLLSYAFVHKDVPEGNSDGFINSESQAWGKCFGRYELDHFGNLGFFLQFSARKRARARQEFEKLVTDVVTFVKELVSN